MLDEPVGFLPYSNQKGATPVRGVVGYLAVGPQQERYQLIPVLGILFHDVRQHILEDPVPSLYRPVAFWVLGGRKPRGAPQFLQHLCDLELKVGLLVGTCYLWNSCTAENDEQRITSRFCGQGA